MRGLFFISIHIIYNIYQFLLFYFTLNRLSQTGKKKKKTVCVTKFKTHFGKYYRILCMYILHTREISINRIIELILKNPNWH